MVVLLPITFPWFFLVLFLKETIILGKYKLCFALEWIHYPKLHKLSLKILKIITIPYSPTGVLIIPSNKTIPKKQLYWPWSKCQDQMKVVVIENTEFDDNIFMPDIINKIKKKKKKPWSRKICLKTRTEYKKMF